MDLRYSTNCGTTLTTHREVYLVGTVGSDGLFYLADVWHTQTLPSTDDGKVYILLGNAYNTYCIQLYPFHPIYYFKDGKVRQYLVEQETDPVFSASPAANITSADITSWNGKVDKVTSTDNAVVRFDGTSGAVQNSGVTINDSDHVTAAKFITRGATSSQFVKGDGTLDSTSYAPLASPTLTGTPTAPTAAASTNSTQIATTAFVKTAISGKQDTISDLATIRSGASAGATAYQKPSGGIPKTDLASAVQTSLGKADTAIQSLPFTLDIGTHTYNNH